jgi:hypothetical protein
MMIKSINKIDLQKTFVSVLIILLFSSCRTITSVKEYGSSYEFRGCYDLYAKRVKSRKVTTPELIEIVSKYNSKHNTKYQYFYFSYNRFNNKGGHIIVIDKNQIDKFKFIPTQLNEPKFYAERVGDYKIDDIIARSIPNSSEYLTSRLVLSSSQMRSDAYLNVQNLLKEIHSNFSNKMSMNSRINLEYHQIFNKSYTKEDITYDAKEFVKRYANQNNSLVLDMFQREYKKFSFLDLCEIGTNASYQPLCKSELINKLKSFEYTDLNNFSNYKNLLNKYYPELVSSIEIHEIKFINGYLPKGTYLGQLANGKPEGIGVWQSDDKKMVYVGEWKKGKFDGRGNFRLSGQSNEIDNYGITGNFKDGIPNDNSMSVISRRIEKEDLDLKEKLLYTLAGATRVYSFPIKTWSEVSKRIMGKLEEVEEENRIAYESERKYSSSDESMVESKERVKEVEKEIDYENIKHPGVEKEDSWEGPSTSFVHGTYYTKAIEFKDDTKGNLFKDKNGIYFIDTITSFREFKNFQDALNALYVLKKHGILVKSKK